MAHGVAFWDKLSKLYDAPQISADESLVKWWSIAGRDANTMREESGAFLSNEKGGVLPPKAYGLSPLKVFGPM